MGALCGRQQAQRGAQLGLPGQCKQSRAAGGTAHLALEVKNEHCTWPPHLGLGEDLQPLALKRPFLPSSNAHAYCACLLLDLPAGFVRAKRTSAQSTCQAGMVVLAGCGSMGGGEQGE